MIKVERTPTPPASLAAEKQKASGNYKQPDVIEQLSQDFHNKCYLCEIVPPHGIEVEHLQPLRRMLSRTYKFAGFTRAYVRAHLEAYPGLAEYVQLQYGIKGTNHLKKETKR